MAATWSHKHASKGQILYCDEVLIDFGWKSALSVFPSGQSFPETLLKLKGQSVTEG